MIGSNLQHETMLCDWKIDVVESIGCNIGAWVSTKGLFLWSKWYVAMRIFFHFPVLFSTSRNFTTIQLIMIAALGFQLSRMKTATGSGTGTSNTSLETLVSIAARVIVIMVHLSVEVLAFL